MLINWPYHPAETSQLLSKRHDTTRHRLSRILTVTYSLAISKGVTPSVKHSALYLILPCIKNRPLIAQGAVLLFWLGNALQFWTGINNSFGYVEVFEVLDELAS